MYSQRNYSRSPRPSKSSNPSSQVPTFQPPSFYAAAAGMPYPNNIPPPSRQEDFTSPNINITYPTQTVAEGSDHANTNNGGHHDGPKQRKRSTSISRSIARAIPRSHKHEREQETSSRRKSQLNNIPLLETHLIPSLRDTIDRMTHPPAPADLGNHDTHRPSDTRAPRISARDESIAGQPFVSHTSPYVHNSAIPALSPIAGPSNGRGLLPPDPYSRPSPRITVEGPTPAKESRPLRTARGILASPGDIEASPMHRGYSPHDMRSPRIQETSEGRSKIPYPKSSRSNPGTPKSAMRTPSALATPRITQSPMNQSAEFEHDYGRRVAGGTMKVVNPSPTATSSESGDSEREREQWRQRSNAWGHSRRLETSAGNPRERSNDHHLGSSKIPSRRAHSKPRPHRVGLGLNMSEDDQLRDEDSRDGHENEWAGDIDTNEARRDHRLASSRQNSSQHTKSSFRENLRRQEASLYGLSAQVTSSIPPSAMPRAKPSSDQERYHASHTRPPYVEPPSVTEEQHSRETRQSRNRSRTAEVATEVTRRRHSRETKQVHDDLQSRRYSRGQEDTAASHPTYRSRRSSSVPAAAHAIGENPLLLPPRSEKSVRFQYEDASTRKGERDGVKERHRTSTSIDVSRGSRRESNGNHNRCSKEIKSHREREAFGIPHSLSYTGKDDSSFSASDSSASVYDEQGGHSHLPHAESDLSSVDGGSWQPKTATGDFSRGAESLFQSLNVDDEAEERKIQRRRNFKRDNRPFERQDPIVNSPFEHSISPNQQARYSVSESISTPSVYEESFEETETSLSTPREEQLTLQSVMDPRMYSDLLMRHGDTEMKRQDIIYELSSTEATFVRCLRSTVRRFILPLRQKDSKAWVLGVPEPVSRLFDWLEDIVNLHIALGEALVACGDLWRAGDIVHKVAETIRAFVPRFEVYQPYLIRVDRVIELITQAVTNRDDQLGEFFRLREQEATRDRRPLVELLKEPVTRLGRYPCFFEKLLDHTPRSHSDYLASLSLLHSARMTLQVLNEVRKREIEYDRVKGILTQIAGVPTSVVAQRERRLLWEGSMNMEATGGQRNPRTGRDTESTSRNGGSKIKLVVFTDMITLATSESRSRRHVPESGGKWRALGDIGASRILRLDEEARSVSLDLLPLAPDDVQTGIISEATSSQSLRLVIPASWTAEQRGEALTALRKCHAYAIRSLSFPSHSGKYLSHGLQVDLEQDTKQSVMAIISTGLPLPKSPSVQMADVRKGQGADGVEQEREERGWWSLRFQQVMREMQRQNVDQILQS